MSLIVTCSRHFEGRASSEIERLLCELGAKPPQIQKSAYSGILLVETEMDPTEATRQIRVRLGDEPWSVRYSHRIIPIQQWIKTDTGEIISSALRLAQDIRPGQTYRVTVEKRDSDVSTREIIEGIAELVDKSVSLESPDQTILVEILGVRTGLSLLGSCGVLSVEREKRALSE